MPDSISEFTANGRKRRGSSGSPLVAASQASAPAGIAKPSTTGIAQAPAAAHSFQPRSTTGRSGGWRVVVGWKRRPPRETRSSASSRATQPSSPTASCAAAPRSSMPNQAS